MEFARTPRWNLAPAAAIALQRELAGLVELTDSVDAPAEAGLVAGVDMAVGRFAGTGRAAAVIWRVGDHAVVEQVAVESPVAMPYIPGLLSFREGPAVEAALRALRTEPDVLLVDGQGIAHPRRLGIAAHLGVLLDRPVIGVGKSRLFGVAEEPGPEPGDHAPLHAPNGELLGYVLRTRRGTKPLYVSPGNRISPERALRVVRACLAGHRLPEPQYLADRLTRVPGV